MGVIRYIKNQFRHDRNVKKAFQDQYEELMLIRQLLVEQRCMSLSEKTMNSHKEGVTEERLCDHNVVVSLTSYGNRIYDVSLVIESIMQGTVKPNRIVLWLSEEEFKNKTLPRALEMQKSRGLKVEYCEEIRSYKKLIPSLKKYPDACIITIDDDLLYPFDFLERLITTHLNNPKAICAYRLRTVELGEDGKPNSYLNWGYYLRNTEVDSKLLFPTTGGGVIFPPNCFNQEVFNQNAFMTLCPYADDVWFYAMRLLNNIKVVPVYTTKPFGNYVELPSAYVNALYTENTDPNSCRNDVQIKAVFEKYGLYDKLKTQSDCNGRAD